MYRWYKIGLLLCLLWFLSSCKKNFNAPTWDVDLLAPLVKSTLTLNNLLSDSILVANSDSSLKIVYQSDVFDIDVDSIFKIPDTTIVEEFSVPLTSIVGPGNSVYSNDEEKELNINNGIELNFVSVESGMINLEVFSEIKEKVIVELKILNAFNNGDTLTIVDIIDGADSSGPGYFQLDFDISGYDLDLTGINHNKFNTLVTKAIATLDTNAAPTQVTAGEKITFKYSFVDVVPYYVRGYFGNQQVHYGPDTTAFDMFDDISGTIDFNEVNVNLDFENGFGVDAQVTLNQLTSYNSNDNISKSLSHDLVGSPININRAQETFSTPEVLYSYYENEITTDNSNIDELIELLPNQLIYEVDLNLNPLGNISGSNDFVFKKHPLKTHLNVEFPLSLVANDFTLSDTADFKLDEESIKNINYGAIHIYADNGYPLEASFDLELLDENGSIFKTLELENNVIYAADVDAELKVEESNLSVVTANLSKLDLVDLTKAKQVKITVGFSTAAQPQFIKIYDHYKIDVKVVADFSYKMNN